MCIVYLWMRFTAVDRETKMNAEDFQKFLVVLSKVTHSDVLNLSRSDGHGIISHRQTFWLCCTYSLL